ncbi:Hypothetical protein PHPALM_4055 [Phytophthora palmivora]|uniref:Uncharacterized protein n=1 Tax=Phytophthora palmivora TaxID=4796 RepID=A0A2P4YKT4_9STRA|nr:Hypothetical protein PHPALM_4055 [Phytophthora palmivora]
MPGHDHVKVAVETRDTLLTLIREEADAAAEEAEADAFESVSLPALEVVDEVEDWVMLSAEAEVLVIVTSESVLALEVSAEPTVASSVADSLPATPTSRDELPVPTVLLSNRVSSVSVVALALALVLVISELSKLLSVFEPELELTVLVDADADVETELMMSCAQAALTAIAQAMVKRRTCIIVVVFWE